jgi:hypothetical protein
VQILLDINRGSDGRLIGTATLAGRDDELPFSGTLQLLAQVEELTRRAHPDQSIGDQ